MRRIRINYTKNTAFTVILETLYYIHFIDDDELFNAMIELNATRQQLQAEH